MKPWERFAIVFVALATYIVTCTCALAEEQMQMVFAPFRSENDIYAMQVANVDGSNIRPVLPLSRGPYVLSVAVDPRDQTIYYGGYAGDYNIARVRIDGSGHTALYSLLALDPLVFNRPNATPSPYGISLDPIHDKLYWVGGQNNSNGFAPGIPTFIQRSNLDGSNVEIVRQTLWSVSSPYSLVVDGASDKMYWTELNDFSIRTANLDGTEMRTVIQRGTMPPPFENPRQLGGLAIDFQRQLMFWSELTPDHRNTNVMSAKLDGSEITHLLSVNGTAPSWFGMPTVIGMAVDPENRHLYFADASGGSINRLNYDGSDRRTLIFPTPSPFGLALVPIPEPRSVVLGLCSLIGVAWWLKCAMQSCRTAKSRHGESP